MTDKEIFDIVHEENLGVDINKVEPRNTDPSQECNSVVPELTDQEIYNKKCESIKLDWDELNLKVGGVFRLSASVVPSGANIPTLIWESSDPSIATVTQDGIVSVIKSGSVKITATNSQDTSIFAECTITVIKNGVTSIEITPSSAEIVKKQTTKLTATVKPDNADNKTVTWVSMDKPIATVDSEGTVTGVSVGKATIKAIATDGSKVEGICTITVTPIKVSTVTVESSKTITKGETFTPSLTVEPEDADNKAVTWTSDHPEFASVDPVSGLVTGVAAGSAIITATAKDGSDQSGTCTVTVKAAKVTKITLSETEKTLEKGHTFNLTATVEPENADNKGITWSSEADGTCTVTQEGLVTAKAAGTTNIVATAKDGSGITAKCSVTVNPTKVSGITLNPTSKTVTKGETFEITATVEPSDADNKTLVWESNDQGKATVDNGNVTTKAAGSVIITAKAQDGSNISSSCNVTINPKKVSGITIDPTSKTIDKGSTFKITPTVEPSDADNKNVTWESDHPEVASVDDGTVTGVAAGSATITVTAADGSGQKATCNVTVNPKKVTKVTMSESTKTVTKGDTFKLSVTITPDDADNKAVTWDSSEKDKATVDQEGNVTTLAAGSTNITATAKDGSNQVGTCALTINPKKVTEIVVDPSTKSIAQDETFTPSVTVTPNNADNKAVTWSSNHPEFASVDPASGLVTGVAAGEATITATAKDGSGITGTCTVTVTPKE